VKGPNILLIITEQQQGKVLDPSSQCLAPALDGLAREGVRFSRAYTVNAICSPARASLFTSVMPSTHGMVDCTHTVEPYRAKFNTNLEMWSQCLQRKGYQMGYFGKWHVERSNQLEKFGFDEHKPPNSPEFIAHRERLGLPPQPERYLLRYVVKQKGYRDFLLYGVYDEPAEGTNEYYLYSEAIEFIRKAAGRDRPWCAVISTRAVHDPFLVPESYYARYDPSKIERPSNFEDDLADKPSIYRRMRSVWKEMTWEHYAEAIACYYGYCSLVDDQMARLLQVLEETGQADSTIVIYTADHGEMIGAHGLMLKGVFPFEEGYRIPLIIRWPQEGLVGETCDRLVSLLDLAPTILEVTGCDELPNCQGRSLVPLLRGEEPEDWPDDVFAEFHGQRFFWTQRIVWTQRYKYVFNGFDYDELYDLERDPHELTNLAGDPHYADVCEEMAARMWARIKALGDHNMFNAQYGMFRFAPIGPEG